MDGGEDFGLRLRRVRELRQLDGMTVARNALGPAATAEQHTQFANYLSRIEREDVNVSKEKMREIARGLGFAKMSAFWQAIEQAVVDGEVVPPAILSLPSGPAQGDNPPSALPKADHDDPPRATLSHMDLQSIERIAFGAADKIKEAIFSAEQRLAKSQPADAPARPKATGGRRAARPRARKTA